MAEIQKKRAFEQLEEIRYVARQLEKEYSKAKQRTEKRKLETQRAAEREDDDDAAAGNITNPTRTSEIHEPFFFGANHE